MYSYLKESKTVDIGLLEAMICPTNATTVCTEAVEEEQVDPRALITQSCLGGSM